MIHVQRWSPDSCGCILLETWDDEPPAEARIHTFQAFEHICDAHAGRSGVALYDVIRRENRRKNLVWAMALALQPDLDLETYGWQFDDARGLRVMLPSLTPAQRAAVQTAADLQFGPEKVMVV